MASKIGWIGCGVMGRWMVQHCIDAGYAAFVYNRTVSKCQPLIDQGAVLCKSPAEVANYADAIFTIVGHPKDVEQVTLGKDGIISGLKSRSARKAVVVDMTTSRPSLAQKISKEMQSIGCYGLDAPVTGGDVGAKEGRLAIMVGGPEVAFNKVKGILKCMANAAKGGAIQLVGDSGAGQHTKMTNQILIATNMIGVVEAFIYAYKSGLDVEKTFQIVSTGAAGSWSLSNYGPRMLNRDFDPGCYVEYFVKDMEIALDEARSMNLSLPGLALAHQLYLALQWQGDGRKGTQALLLALKIERY